MANKVEIISNAFIRLGKGPITDLQTGNPEKAATLQLYDTSVYPTALQLRPWTFALTVQDLNQVVSPPEIPNYSFAYQLPTDPNFLIGYAVYPQLTNFLKVGDLLYANSSTLKLVYTTVVPEENLPPSFVTFLINFLTSEIAYLVTQQNSIAQYWDKKAQLAFSVASSVDSAMQPNLAILDQPIYNAHFVG